MMKDLSYDDLNNGDYPFLERMHEIGKVRIFRFKGDLNQEVIVEIIKMREELKKGNETEDKNILFDFAKVTDVDTSAVATLLLRMKELQATNHRLAIINATEKFQSMLEIFKVDHQILVFDSEEEALKELG